MKKIIEESELIIFDMDGTLYEGQGHYDYYAHHLAKTLPIEIQKPFLNTYESIMNNDHILTIGSIYDVLKDWVLYVHPITLEVEKAFTFEGEEIDELLVKQTYIGRIRLEEEKRFVSVGDGWWVPISIAVHYGHIPSFDSYFATKEYMVTTKDAMQKTEGLEDALATLRGNKKLAVVTNSDKDDALMVLEALQLTSYFHTIVPGAKKPIKTAEVFGRICTEHNVKIENAVSIGDNFLNEIYPAIDLGMRGIHITNKPDTFVHQRYLPIETLANMLG